MTTTTSKNTITLNWIKTGHLCYESGQYRISHHGPRHGFSVIRLHDVQDSPWAKYDYVTEDGRSFRLLADAKAAAEAHANQNAH